MKTLTLTAAAALALALPAAAQTQTPGPISEGLTWQDVATPRITFQRMDGSGNVTFSTAPRMVAPGTDAATADAIREADGETLAATDPMGADADAGGDMEGGVETMAGRADDGTEGMAPDRAAGVPDDGFDTAGTAGGRLSDQPVTTNTGMAIDMTDLAREMYRQGYQQGYASGITQAMSDERWRRGPEQGFTRGDFAAQAQDTRQGMRQAMPSLYQDEAGNRFLIVPQGMRPQDALRMMQGG
jgi:hypothetical protein